MLPNVYIASSYGSGCPASSSGNSNRTHWRVGALAFLLLAVLAGAREARAQSVDFGSLIVHLQTMSGLPESQRDALTANLLQASQNYGEGQACNAVSLLGDAVGITQGFRDSVGAGVADDLFLRFWQLRHAILESLPPETTCPGFEAVGDGPSNTLGQNDAMALSGVLNFGIPNLRGVAQDSTVWTRVEIPGLDGTEGETRLPAVPVYRRLIAVPRGASVSVTLTESPEVAYTVKARLAPFIEFRHEEEQQGEPVPEIYSSPLDPDPTVYAQASDHPATVARVIMAGQLRYLDIAVLEVAAGQYNPVDEELKLFKSVSWSIQFNGGDGTFVPTDGPFDSFAALYDTTLNNAALDFDVYELPEPLLVGEELMILASPDFQLAADDLASWKNSRGIPTNVFFVGAGAELNTREEIRDLIADHVFTAITPPSYVLLLGDVGWIPTWIIPRESKCQDPQTFEEKECTPPNHDIATDLPYTYAPGAVAPNLPMPYVTIARIPANHPEIARTMVRDLIKPYEQTPPSDDSSHQTVSLVNSTDCKAEKPGAVSPLFAQFSETIVPTLEGDGRNVERIYQLNCETSFTPAYFSNFEEPPNEEVWPLASAIGPGSGFAWDGDAAQIVDALSDGRLLSAYLGHGVNWGWWEPLFTSGDVVGLLTPYANPATVVYSLACNTGRFDLPDGNLSFAETLLSKGHAVAVVAASRGVSLGSRMLNPLVDASWPQHDPNQGSPTPLARIGDIYFSALLHAYFSGGQIDKMWDDAHSYHLLGDPTVELPVEASSDLLEGDYSDEYSVSDGVMDVLYPVEGAIISALQEGPNGVIPLGRAKVQGGTAQLELVNEIQGGLPVLLAASLPGGGSVSLNSAAEVPSLSNWGLAAMAALLAAAAAAARWRQLVRPGRSR